MIAGACLATHEPNPFDIVPIFVGAWILLSVAAMLFYWRAGLEAKRRCRA
jgi:hypothetical protein